MEIYVHTGRKSFSNKIANYLAPRTGYTFVSEAKQATVVVCSPDYVKTFQDNLMLVLSDDINIMIENDTVIDVVPIPLTDDDYVRLEWKLAKIVDDLQDAI